MSRMGSHDPYGYLKHKLWPKEELQVKLPIWLSTIKSQESPWFPCVEVACHIPWKYLNKGYNYTLYITSIIGLHIKLWARKVSRLQLGSPETKWHLGASPMAMHKEYYKGEGGGFPQVWAMVSLVSPCLPVAHLCNKTAPTMH
jgi:hypothetical protein